MKRVWAPSVYHALLDVDPDVGTKSHKLPSQQRQTLLRNGLVDIADGDEENVLVLTKVGLAMQQLLVEIRVAGKIIESMKEQALASVMSPIAHQGRAAAIPAHRRIGGSRPPAMCGTLNHDSFDAFIKSLNAAGKNRWQDPNFTGAGPAGGAKPGPEGNDHG